MSFARTALRSKTFGTASRTGFSIIEVLAAIAIIVVVAALLVSSDNPETPNDRARYDAAADALYNLSQAIAGNEPSKAARSFHQVVGVYPGKLSDLTTLITTASSNICGTPYTGGVGTAGSQMFKWQNSPNPFYGSQLLTTGTPLAPGFTVQDALVRLNAVAASGAVSSNTMIIRMPSVTLADAKGLDLAVDGAVDGASGTVRYSTASDPTVVDYYISISITNSTLPQNC